MSESKPYLHLKRVHFEPVVFHWLRKQQPERLNTFWTNYQPPLTANKTICIVERREHPNFDFILKNVCYFCQKSAEPISSEQTDLFCEEWSITVICSNENYAFVKKLLEGKQATILPLFEGIGTPEKGKEEYNDLLQTERFWKGIDAEWILTVEMDCYLLRPLPKEMFEYDYVASHWSWDKTSMGGGLSLRKREAMLQICSHNFPKQAAQDVWVNAGCKALGLKTPAYVLYENWFVESCFSFTPVGVHQFWTFWDSKHKYANEEFAIHTRLLF